MSLSTESKLELETHHSNTIFCDMMSPDEWKSSLPLVFQQSNASVITNSLTSPSNSIEDLVLELENSSPDIDLGSPFSECPDNLMFRVSSSDKYEEEELVCNMDADENNMHYETTATGKEIDLNAKKLISENDEPKLVEMTGTQFQTEAVGNQQKSSDPLSIFLSHESIDKSNLAEVPTKGAHPTVARESQHETTEKVPIPEKGKYDVSLQRLTSRLAKVTHCSSPNNASVLQKATSTISTLRQQACDLMSTYSQLKFQNDELIQKQHQLHSEQFFGEPGQILNGCPLIIEVLIPTPGEKNAFDSARLYHHIPIEDGQIPTTSGDESYSATEDLLEEPYEEQYDAQTHTTLLPLEAIPCKNKKPPCKLGCICSSLDAGKLPVEHCKNLNCMLNSKCSQPEDPSHPRDIGFKITNKRNVCLGSILVRSRTKARKVSAICSSGSSPKKVPRVKTKYPRRGRPKKNVVFLRDPKIDPRDPKLLDDCNVRLVKLDPRALYRKPNGHFDAKLYMKCSVQLQRLQKRPDQPVYCMYHSLHNCICCL